MNSVSEKVSSKFTDHQAQKLFAICLDYIEAAELLFEGYSKRYGLENLAARKPLIYVLSHAYECFLKGARLHFNLSGKEKSHNLIELAKDLSGKIDSGLIQYAVWLSNHHGIDGKKIEKNSYPDRYDDYQFNSKKVYELLDVVRKKQIEIGMEDLDALGVYNTELDKRINPQYRELRTLISNSIRIVPKDFSDCIDVIKSETKKLKE